MCRKKDKINVKLLKKKNLLRLVDSKTFRFVNFFNFQHFY